MQSFDYYPFGMNMPGRNYSASSSYRYGFNGKENDNSTGESSLDYGARIMDARLGRWLSVDLRFREYSYVSPFIFAFNTPLQAMDPDGEKVLWVNGYYNTGILADYAGSKANREYWAPDFIAAGNEYFKDANNKFIDGRGKWNSNGKERYNAGYAYAKANYDDLVSGMKKDKNGNIIETFKVVSHSMGAAYAEGIINYLESKGLKVEQVVHLSPADPSGFKASTKPLTTEINYTPDYVLRYKNFGENSEISGVDNIGVLSTPTGEDPAYNHLYTKSNKNVWQAVSDLVNATFTFSHSVINTFTVSDPKIDAECGCQEKVTSVSMLYNIRGLKYNTQFLNLTKGGKTYTNVGEGLYGGPGGYGIRKTIPLRQEKESNFEP